MNPPDRSRDSIVPSRRLDLFIRLAPWLGVLALAAWTRWPSVPLLVFAWASALTVLAARSGGGRARALSSAVILAGVMVGSFGHIALRRISQDFDAYWSSRSARAEEAVTRIGNLASGGTNTTVLDGLRDVR
jgi:hypothetical protein